MAQLNGKKVAFLVTDGFEQVELTEPLKALEKEGAETIVVSPKTDTVRGWNHAEWGDDIDVDLNLKDAKATDFDALVLPGGVINPDKLRIDKSAVAFIKEFVDARKPIGAICHGPWTLIEAGATKDREMTSYSSIKTDLINSGARWVDREVVVDNGLVTSRDPKDLKAFIGKLIEEILEGIH